MTAPERIWARPDYNECWPKRLEEEDVEYVRADLAAAPAQVRVKPLVWSSVQEPSEACRYHHVTSESTLGQYRIEWKGWKIGDSMVVYRDEQFLDTASTLEAAKAAAQADYETRILAALEPHPDPRDDVIARLVEALEMMRSTYPYNPPCYGWQEQVEAHKAAKAALAAAKAVQHG